MLSMSGLAAVMPSTGCTAGSPAPGDGGLEASSPFGASDSGAGGLDASIGDDASSSADAAATCMRQAELDTDCATTFGASAPHGYACSDVFTHTPPCQPLTSRGCTEICSNRCCP